MCPGARSALLPQMAAVGRARGKFTVRLPPPPRSPGRPGGSTHLLGKVGQDLGTDPIQPLDDFSLKHTDASALGSSWGRRRPAPGGLRVLSSLRRGQLGPGSGQLIGPTGTQSAAKVESEAGSLPCRLRAQDKATPSRSGSRAALGR